MEELESRGDDEVDAAEVSALRQRVGELKRGSIKQAIRDLVRSHHVDPATAEVKSKFAADCYDFRSEIVHGSITDVSTVGPRYTELRHLVQALILEVSRRANGHQ